METKLEVIAGTGGAESEAWAAMVLRMYLRWAVRHSLTVKPGREIVRSTAGIKRAALTIVGDEATKLASEVGIHRLVRRSPFDSEARRHTSFTTVLIEGVRAPSDRMGVGQIRSYVLDPYLKVKDLRTAVERDDVHAVLDGDIDGFLDAAEALGLPFTPDPNGPEAEVAVAD